MGTYVTKYFNGPTLEAATTVYDDDALTTPAADGWYSDGITTRQQTAGVLGPPLVCPDCYLPCNEEVADTQNVVPVPTNNNYMGTYETEVNLSDGIGAVLIRVRLQNEFPTGIIAQYGTAYTSRSNKFSASDGGGSNGGYRGAINATPLTANNLPLWVGATSNISQTAPPGACGAATAPQLPDNSPFLPGVASPTTLTGATLPTYIWQANPNQYEPGVNQNITVETQQVQLGPGSANWLLAVIPKTEATPSTLAITLQQMGCSISGKTFINVECPVQLTGFNTSYVQATVAEVCEVVIEGTPQEVIYNAPGAAGVTGTGAPAFEYAFGVPNLWDFAFIDPNGETYAAEGYYKYLNASGEIRYFHVDQYGVIDETDVECVPPDTTCTTLIEASSTGPGIYNAYVPMGAPAGAMIVRVFTGVIADGVLIEHETGGTWIPYNVFSATGGTIGSCDGFLAIGNYTTGNSEGGGVRNTEAGGVDLTYPPESKTVFVGRVLKPSCSANEGFAQYPFTEYSGNTAEPTVATNSYCSPNNSLFGKINLPPNGIHNLEPGFWGTICNMPNGLFDDGNLTDAQTTVTPFPNSAGDYIYPDCTTNFGGSNPDYFPLYEYNTETTNWDEVPSGASTITIIPEQVQITINHPGWMIAVIPKPLAVEEQVKITIESIVCNTGFKVYADCVAALPNLTDGVNPDTAFAGAGTAGLLQLAAWCAAPPATALPIYLAHGSFGGVPTLVNSNQPCIPGVVGTGACNAAGALTVNLPYRYDMAFQDANGVTKADEGYYFYVDAGVSKWFQVDSYGVIFCIKLCTDLTPC